MGSLASGDDVFCAQEDASNVRRQGRFLMAMSLEGRPRLEGCGPGGAPERASGLSRDSIELYGLQPLMQALHYSL